MHNPGGTGSIVCVIGLGERRIWGWGNGVKMKRQCLCSGREEKWRGGMERREDYFEGEEDFNVRLRPLSRKCFDRVHLSVFQPVAND